MVMFGGCTCIPAEHCPSNHCKRKKDVKHTGQFGRAVKGAGQEKGDD